MRIPLRILRREAEDRHRRPAMSGREHDRETRILEDATAMIARHGWRYVTFRDLAEVAGISPTTLRRHFADLESVLGKILSNHLATIAKAIGEVPFSAPDAKRLRRQAYITATRHPLGGPSAAHYLLLAHRGALPDDVRLPLEATRDAIGQSLAGAQAEFALNLMDQPYLEAPLIEKLLALAVADAEIASHQVAAPAASPAAEPPMSLAPKPAPARPAAPPIRPIPPERTRFTSKYLSMSDAELASLRPHQSGIPQAQPPPQASG